MTQRNTTFRITQSSRFPRAVERLRAAHAAVVVIGLVLIGCGGAG